MRPSTSGTGDSAAELWNRARALLKDAEAAGIENPVIVGAIPFSKSASPEIFVPIAYNRDKVKRGTERTRKIIPVTNNNSHFQDHKFVSAVDEVLKQIADKKLDKAVLSRTLELRADLQGAGNAIVDRLLELYPSAYNFYLPLGEDHYWLGASPELLLRRKEACVESFPLAGSTARHRHAEQDREAAHALLASHKDRSEHQFVVDEIAHILAPVCEQVEVPNSPSLVPAGPLWHLGTPISATLKTPYPSAMELAARLHPTPAVCGYPTQTAWELIDRLEPHARGLYAGMVGWTDAQGNGEWAVTIRCAQYLAGTLRLFAGAGIVADSSPTAEWQETNTKLSTLLQALGVTEEVCT
ncbi:isochorismate synthase MenF [Pseudomonas sp. NPDC089734]|uniref:isochorismate synthase n=1 Tax=Pseudomonas sp. NPDC089734 TaxID=3364469 RepID=UPI00382B7A2E